MKTTTFDVTTRRARRPVPDRSLVALMAARDREALEQLRARHGKSMYALAYGILVDPDDADRVVTEAFEYAWDRAALVCGVLTGSVSNWLCGLTRTGALARARTKENGHVWDRP